MEATADAASAAFRQERRDKNGLQKSSFPRIYLHVLLLLTCYSILYVAITSSPTFT